MTVNVRHALIWFLGKAIRRRYDLSKTWNCWRCLRSTIGAPSNVDMLLSNFSKIRECLYGFVRSSEQRGNGGSHLIFSFINVKKLILLSSNIPNVSISWDWQDAFVQYLNHVRMSNNFYSDTGKTCTRLIQAPSLESVANVPNKWSFWSFQTFQMSMKSRARYRWLRADLLQSLIWLVHAAAGLALSCSSY